jgi:23S rRNA (uracil1939-C5)-methyltransferase
MPDYQKDQILELTIHDLSEDGKGIARTHEGLVVFVNNCVPADKVKAKIIRVKKKFAKAELLEITDSSIFRTEPECEHFGICNGCKMQNLFYDYQLKLKKQRVIDAFERIGNINSPEVPDAVPADNIYYYRNKLEFSFSNNRWLTEADKDSEEKNKTFALGFHMPNFIDKVLEINRCHLQSEVSNKILNLTRDFFKSKGESIYSTIANTGYLRFLIIRRSFSTDDIMVNLITSTINGNLTREYAAEIKQNVPETTTLINMISSSRAQVAKGDSYDVIFGSGFITERIGKYSYKILPSSFFQTNSVQAKKLFDAVIQLGEFSKSEEILDLYCGAGAISIYISEYVKKITGVELSQESINSAIENAELNKVKNCEFISYDVKDYLLFLIDSKMKSFDTIILDPPRSGIHPKAAECIMRLEPEKIIYVSCNPSTQARDIKLLTGKYEIKKIQPVDMFPHTFHIENVVRLDLRK